MAYQEHLSLLLIEMRYLEHVSCVVLRAMGAPPPNLGPDTLGSSCSGCAITLYSGYTSQTIVHEFGHWLGFEDSDNRRSVMYRYENSSATHFIPQEIEELWHAYNR
jgi:hypothetical protein